MTEHFVLCGMQGAGKTTLGRELARQCEALFYDTDAMVLSLHGGAKSCAHIVETEGLSAFRAYEGEVLKELTLRPKGIIALGGGTLDCPNNQALACKLGPIIYLKIDKIEAKKRMRITHTPFDILYPKRAILFETLAHRCVHNIQELKQAWQEIYGAVHLDV